MGIVRISIGARVVDDACPLPPVTAKVKSSARYYDDFSSYLFGLVGIAHAIESVRGNVSTYRPDDTAIFACKQSGGVWCWLPAPTLMVHAANHIPPEMFLQRFPANQPEGQAVLQLGAMNKLLGTFAQVLATNYFERHRATIELHYGTVATWPSVWNFARVVRNAMAHGGRLSIRNPNEQPVSWKGLTYSHSDNGRDILISDLWPGDLFDMILEMDQVVSLHP